MPDFTMEDVLAGAPLDPVLVNRNFSKLASGLASGLDEDNLRVLQRHPIGQLFLSSHTRDSGALSIKSRNVLGNYYRFAIPDVDAPGLNDDDVPEFSGYWVCYYSRTGTDRVVVSLTSYVLVDYEWAEDLDHFGDIVMEAATGWHWLRLEPTEDEATFSIARTSHSVLHGVDTLGEGDVIPGSVRALHNGGSARMGRHGFAVQNAAGAFPPTGGDVDHLSACAEVVYALQES